MRFTLGLLHTKFTSLCLFLAGTFVADENGSNDPLRRYTDKTLVIVLPGDLTVFDIGNHDIIILLPSIIGNV